MLLWRIYNPDLLERLLKALKTVQCKKPVYKNADQYKLGTV
jgi:hypothetical protein